MVLSPVARLAKTQVIATQGHIDRLRLALTHKELTRFVLYRKDRNYLDKRVQAYYSHFRYFIAANQGNQP